MSRSLRRGALAAAALFIPLTLTACAAGNNAETGKIRPDTVSVTAGDIQIQNGLVITSGKEGESPAAVSARIFNNGTEPETLSKLTLPETGIAVEVRDADGRAGTLTVPAGGSVLLGGKGNPSATIPAAGTKGLLDGNLKKLAFQFDDSGAVTMSATVVPAKGYYTDFGPSAPAEASATPAAEASETATTEPAAEPSTESTTEPSTGAESATGTDTEDAAQPSGSPAASDSSGH